VAVTWFYPDQTGFLDFSYRIRALAGRHELTVLARAPVTQPELRIPGVEYRVIPTPDARRIHLIPYVIRVARLLRRIRPDRVVFLGSQIAFGTLLCRKIPSIVYWNEHPTHYYPPTHKHFWVRAHCRAGRLLTYLGARFASLVLPIGEAQRDDLIEHGCAPDRVRLMYMGVDGSFEPPRPAPPPDPGDEGRPLRLVYVGSISGARGRDVMLGALAMVNRQRRIATLTLVGATPEQAAECASLAQRLGIGDALTVVGRVPGGAVPGYLRNADVGLCLWEDIQHWRYNPPTKLFEYLVAGLPVMASNIRTHTQYVRHGENGFIFEYHADALAEAIGEAWRRRGELPSMKGMALASGGKYLWDGIEPGFLDAVEHPGVSGGY
jgi:glycosyltransferase involved in cell wall biosynthesis